MIEKLKKWAESPEGKDILKTTAFVGTGSLTGVLINKLVGKKGLGYDIAAGVVGGLGGYGLKRLGDKDVSEAIVKSNKSGVNTEFDTLVKEKNDLQQQLRSQGLTDEEIFNSSKMQDILDKMFKLQKMMQNKDASGTLRDARSDRDLVRWADTGAGVVGGITGSMFAPKLWTLGDSLYIDPALNIINYNPEGGLQPGHRLGAIQNAFHDFVRTDVPDNVLEQRAQELYKIRAKTKAGGRKANLKAANTTMPVYKQYKQFMAKLKNTQANKAVNTINNELSYLKDLRASRAKAIQEANIAKTKVQNIFNKKPDLKTFEASAEAGKTLSNLQAGPTRTITAQDFKAIRKGAEQAGVDYTRRGTSPRNYKKVGPGWEGWGKRGIVGAITSTGSALITDALLGGAQKRQTEKERQDAYKTLYERQ